MEGHYVANYELMAKAKASFGHIDRLMYHASSNFGPGAYHPSSL